MKGESKKKRDFNIKPIHPGTILREEILIPRNISPQELAAALKVSKEQIKWVCEERADITPDLAARLALYFDTSIWLWLNLQRSYEEELAEKWTQLLKEEIVPYNDSQRRKEKRGNSKHVSAH